MAGVCLLLFLTRIVATQRPYICRKATTQVGLVTGHSKSRNLKIQIRQFRQFTQTLFLHESQTTNDCFEYARTVFVRRRGGVCHAVVQQCLNLYLILWDA